jgi:hypothetical protein
MPYFLKLHDLSAPHAYTWYFKTSKNNLIKNVTLYDFNINPTRPESKVGALLET